MAYNFGLLGFPINKSLAPFIYNTFLSRAAVNGGYTLFELRESMELPMLLHFLERFRFTGLNVGAPHKQSILQHVQNVDESVRRLGAADTLHLTKDGWTAYNLESASFSRLLEAADVTVKGAYVMIFGAGASAGAVIMALADRGAESFTVAARREDGVQRLRALFPELEIKYTHFDDIHQATCDIVINALTIDWSNKIWLNRFWPDHNKKFGAHKPVAAIDLQYAPQETPFLSMWEGSGKYNGFCMAVEQAAKSFEIWNGVRPEYSLEELQVKAPQ